MSSTITVKAAATVVELQAAGSDELKACVERGLSEAATKTGMQLQPSAILFSDTKAPVQNWDVEGRLVGSQAVTVIAEPTGSYLEIIHALSVRQAAVEQILHGSLTREAKAWEPRLRNIAAQILLHACGKQEFRTTTSDYFAMLVVAKDSRLQQVAEGMEIQLSVVGKEADNVITRRNKNVHPESLESLETEVNNVRSCITPALEQLCPQECRFVQAYEVIKRAFPECFT